MPGWADPAVTWAGRVNDFSGAGATALIKGYDALLTRMGNQLVQETEDFLRNPGAWSSPLSSGPLSVVSDGSSALDTGAGDARLGFASGLWQAAGSPVSRALTAGLPESTFGVLGKIPYLGFAFTGADMYLHRKDGIGAGVVKPVGNLMAGTALAEGTSSVLAGVATGDGMIAAVGGSALIPGVGEVVITGAVVVGGVMLIDWSASCSGPPSPGVGSEIPTAAPTDCSRRAIPFSACAGRTRPVASRPLGWLPRWAICEPCSRGSRRATARRRPGGTCRRERRHRRGQ